MNTLVTAYAYVSDFGACVNATARGLKLQLRLQDRGFHNFVFSCEITETHAMKINLLLLNGATAMALLGGFGLATPALAQDVNGPSMPSEEAVTRQLNRQAIDGTTQSPAVLNGEIAAQRSEPYYDQSYPRAPDDASSMPGSYGGGYDPAAPTYRDRQYDEQMRAYEDRQNQYRDQRDRYEREMDHYRFERYRYDWVPCYYNPYP